MLLASRRDDRSAVEIKAQTVAIERQTLAERIARAMDGKALASVEAWRKASAELFQILPPGFVDRLAAATSIVIVPDDVLWRVPFEAIPVETTYLADRAVITYAASLAAVVGAPRPPPQNSEMPVIAVHSPLLPAQTLETLKSTAPSWLIRSPESAAAEVTRIAEALKTLPPRVISGPEATRDGLKKGVGAGGRAEPASGLGALHMAAPFRVNSASPLFSAVLLAGEPEGQSTPVRGPELEVRELFNFDPMASVVTLSDPATLSKRDAAASLAPVHWAWRATGATTLILKRWGGDDVTAAEIMASFYEQLRAGKPTVQAFDDARAATRQTEHGRPPAAWAGWLILSGK